MAGTIYSKFFWQDWASDPKLFRCSAGAQGLWMRLLCLAAQADVTGHILIGDRPPSDDDIAHVTGFALEDVRRWKSELIERGVPDITREGTMVSRRMIRDAQKQRRNSEGGKKSAELRGGKFRRNGTGSKGVHEPPSTRVQSPSASPLPPEGVSADQKAMDAGRLATLSQLLEIDYHRSPTGTIAYIQQLIDLERAGVDIEQDLIPCIEQMQASGRDVRGKPFAYFRQPALDFQKARSISAGVEVEFAKQAEARIAAMTEAQWTRHVLWWLFLGEWPEELGAPPLQVGCRAPIEARVIRNLFKKLDEKPYARRQKNCSLLVPFAWPDHQSPATMCSEPELADMQVFLRGGSDLRLEWWAKAVTAEEARAIFAKYDPPKRQVV